MPQDRLRRPVRPAGHLHHARRRRLGQLGGAVEEVPERPRVPSAEAAARALVEQLLLLLQEHVLTEVRRAGVVARARAGVLRAPAGHAVTSALVPGGHPLPVHEAGVDLTKLGAPGGDLVPALDHESVHPRGTVVGTGQELPRSDHLYHFLVAVAVVGLLSKAINLPHEDTERPHIGLGCELPIQDALWGHPSHWQ